MKSIRKGVKNPKAGSPEFAGLSEERRAQFPEELQKRFEGRRWIGVHPVELLDYEGAEVLFIGAFSGASEIAEESFGAEEKSERSSAVIKELHMSEREHPMKPLFEGGWE